MKGIFIPICQKCKKKQSQAIKRYCTKEDAAQQGFCICIYDED